MAIQTYIQKLNPFYQIKKQYEDVKKQLEIYKRAEQPYSADYNYMGSVVPLYPYPLETIYQLAYYSDVLTTIHRALRTQMFKNGYEVVKSSETDHTVVDVDEDLNAEPREEDRLKVLRFLKKCNEQSQEIEEMLKELEDDLNIMDLYYCNFRFDYYFDGKELHRELFAVQRVDPKTMSLVINKRRQYAMDDKGRKLSFSITNRSHILHDTDVDKDGIPTIPAWYRQIMNGTEMYFGEHEFVMGKRYRPAELLGFSPVVTVWLKTRTLQQQDQYILDLYEGKRPPKGLLAFNTNNRDSLKEAWDEMLRKAKINPHLPAVLGITNNGNGKFAEFIDFMKGLDELQFTEQRDEYRRVLGAVYGVSPIFQGDASTGGGLNNEGLQITVTNDAIQDGQHNYNNKLLKKITHELGVVGWSVLLKPSEEQDEMAKLQRQEQSLRNGEVASRLGLRVRYDSRQGECVIDDGEVTPAPEPQDDMFANPFEDNNRDSDGDDTPEEVEPDFDSSSIFKSKKKVELVYKSLPVGAIPLGDNKPPEGAKIVTGPKGGKYIVPSSSNSNKDIDNNESQVSSDVKIIDSDFSINLKSGKTFKISDFRNFSKADSHKNASDIVKSFSGLNLPFRGDLLFLDSQVNGANGFVISNNSERQIFISANSNAVQKQREQYQDYISKQDISEESKNEIKTISDEDFVRKTILHENSHLEVFNKTGDQVLDSQALVRKFPEFKEYVEMAKKTGNKKLIGRIDMNEILAEDLRILRAIENNDKTQHIYSARTHRYDIANKEDYKLRLKKLSRIFKND